MILRRRTSSFELQGGPHGSFSIAPETAQQVIIQLRICALVLLLVSNLAFQHLVVDLAGSCVSLHDVCISQVVSIVGAVGV